MDSISDFWFMALSASKRVFHGIDKLMDDAPSPPPPGRLCSQARLRGEVIGVTAPRSFPEASETSSHSRPSGLDEVYKGRE